MTEKELRLKFWLAYWDLYNQMQIKYKNRPQEEFNLAMNEARITLLKKYNLY